MGLRRHVARARLRRCRGSSATPCWSSGGDVPGDGPAREPRRPDPGPRLMTTWATGRCRSHACSVTATTSSGSRRSGYGRPVRQTATFAFETLGPVDGGLRGGAGQDAAAARRSGTSVRTRSTTARPMWGAAAAVDSRRGSTSTGPHDPKAKGIFGYALQVARARPTNLLDNEQWQYWDGRTWQGSAAKAKELIGADGGVSQTLSVFKRGDRWYAAQQARRVARERPRRVDRAVTDRSVRTAARRWRTCPRT